MPHQFLLVPKLVKMLSDPDSGFRQVAVDALWFTQTVAAP